MRTRLQLGALVAVVFLLAACSNGPPPRPAALETGSNAGAAATPAQESAPAAGGDLASAWDQRKLIREGRLGVRVESVDSASDAVRSITTAHGGLVTGATIEQDGPRGERAQLVVRVPAARFTDCLAELRLLGKPTSESVGITDVTKAYLDLETRLEVKRRTEQRLLGLLATRTAGLSEVLTVERELERVVSEIEQLLADRRHFDEAVALSTIHLDLREERADTTPSFWSPVRQALSDAASLLSWSLSALVYIVTFTAPWLLIAALGWRLRRAWRARHGTLDTHGE